MGILEEINNLKSQGMDDKEISYRLQEKGIAPKAINDAFNQFQIKSAVNAEDEEMSIPTMEEGGGETNTESPPKLYIPKTQEIQNNSSDELYAPQPLADEESPPQFDNAKEEYYQQQSYPQEGQQVYEGEPYVGETGAGYEEGAAYGSDTFIEIAEQVFSENIKKEQKQIENLNEFATLAETKISNNHERLKRMETIMDKLQVAILEKIGSYGKNLESMKSEMEMMQESFTKIVPKLHEMRSTHSHTIHHVTHPTSHTHSEKHTASHTKKTHSRKKKS